MTTNLIPISHEMPAVIGGVPQVVEPKGPQLRHLAGIVLQRLGLAAGVAAVIFLLVMAFTLTRTPTYTAYGSVLVQPRRENLAKAEPEQPGLPPDTSAVDTQVELLRSNSLALDVVKQFKLYNDPELNPKAKHGPLAGEPDAHTLNQVVNRLQQRTQVKRAGLTYVVWVGYSSSSAQKAANVVNDIMQGYLSRQLQEKLNAVSRANSELGQSLESMRKDAEKAEAAVQEYKNAHGLFSAEGATMAEQEVSTLNQQIAAAQAEHAEKVARLNAALAQVQSGGGGEDVGAALGSETIKELRKKEAELSTKLAQLETDFKPEYPEVQRTQAQLNDVHAQIKREIGRILSSLRADAAAAGQREASLLGSRGKAQGGLAANGVAQIGLVALQQRADSAKQIYEAYLNRAKTVAAEGGFQQTDATVASAATPPIKPSAPNKRLMGVVGVLFGLMGGAASILMAELWRRSLRNGAEVERELGVPFAGIMPDYASVAGPRRKRGASAPADYLVAQPLSSFAEALRNLRAFLLFSGDSRPSKLIALTSAVPREGKSMTAFCLARAMALSGSSVVVVDCDLRQRGLTRLVGEPDVGIVEVAEGKTSLQDALVFDAKSGLWVLPCSNGPVPYDLFTKPEADAIFRELSERFDYVLIDTPPILGVADARILAGKVDRVLYVVHWNKTPLSTAQSAIEILHECGAEVAGALLTRVNVKQQARFGFQDDSDYYSYYRNYYVTAA